MIQASQSKAAFQCGGALEQEVQSPLPLLFPPKARSPIRLGAILVHPCIHHAARHLWVCVDRIS